MSKRIGDFNVTDLKALAACNPQMVKLTPNHANIRKYLALGGKLEGIEVTPQQQSEQPLYQQPEDETPALLRKRL